MIIIYVDRHRATIHPTDQSIVKVMQNYRSWHINYRVQIEAIRIATAIVNTSALRILRLEENYRLGRITIYIQQQEDDDKKPQIPAACR
jgi:hypothetical protein